MSLFIEERMSATGPLYQAVALIRFPSENAMDALVALCDDAAQPVWRHTRAEAEWDLRLLRGAIGSLPPRGHHE